MRYVGLVVVLVTAVLSAAGAVYAVDVSGRVVDPTGKAVAQATVTAALVDPEGQVTVRVDGPGSRPFYELDGPSAKTDAKGAFAFKDLNPGWYGLIVLPAAEAKLEPLGEPLYFRIGEKAVDLGTVSLPPAPARIVGRLMIEGKPAELGGASIYDPTYGVESNTVPLDEEGNFVIRLSSAISGRVSLRLVVFSEEAEGFTIRTVEAPAPGGTLDLGTIDLANRPTGGLLGHVADAKLKPVKRDFIIYAYDPKKPYKLQLPPVRSQDGEFGCSLPGGRWRLLFSASGQEPIARDLTIYPDSEKGRKLILKLPAALPAAMKVHCVPVIGEWEFPPSLWKDFPLPTAIVALRRDDQVDIPLWALPWSWIAPGRAAELPRPEGRVTLEFWQVERAGPAFVPVRLIASVDASRAKSLRWDVVASMRANCVGMIKRGTASPAQMSVHLALLADFLEGRGEEPQKRFGVELRKLAEDIESLK